MSIAEAARYLGVSDSNIRNAIKRGELRAARFGKRVLISRQAVEAVVDGAR